MFEAAGIIFCSRFKIVSYLQQCRAFDASSATYFGDCRAVLDMMEQGGLVERTADGKVFLTQKGQKQQIRMSSTRLTVYQKQESQNKTLNYKK